MAGYLGVMAQANIDQDLCDVPPSSDLQTAEMHGHHIAALRGNTGWEGNNYPPITTSHWIVAVPPEKPAVLGDLVS